MFLSLHDVLMQLMHTPGALCAALVDSSSGVLLEAVGGGLDMDVAAQGYSDLVRAKLKTMQSLGMQGNIEDILISLNRQYHIIRPVANYEGLFIYYVLERSQANLAVARRKVQEAESHMVI